MSGAPPVLSDGLTSPAMAVEIRLLRPGDAAVLSNVAPDVFDDPVDEALARQFLDDPGHLIAVALEDDLVVGFVSGVMYVHPDKPRELWVNEVGVVSTHQRRGIARDLLRRVFLEAKAAGCGEAWVLTDRSNEAAMGLYESVGGTCQDQVMFTFGLGSGSDRRQTGASDDQDA